MIHVSHVRSALSIDLLTYEPINMRFMIKEKGGVNAEVFIEFLKRLMIGSKSKIFLIVDRGPAHVAKKTKTFVASLGSRLRLFYLPPYSRIETRTNWCGNISKLTRSGAP